MDELAQEYGFALVAEGYKEKFRELIRRLAERDKVALLIDEYDKPITDLLEIYQLGYPNHEVAQAFQQHLLADYLALNLDRINLSILGNLHKSLVGKDIKGFITILQSIFADIPSHLFLAKEAYYHSVVYLLLRLLGFTAQAERPTNLDRIDAVLETQSTFLNSR